MIIIKFFIIIEFILFLPVIIFQAILLGTGYKIGWLFRLRNRSIKNSISSNIVLIKLAYKFISYIIKFFRRIIIRAIYSKGNFPKLNFEKFYYEVERQTPEEFEAFTANLYYGLGYKVKLMPPGPDGGKDVILTDENGKIYVECKHYTSAIIGREICQKLIGAATADNIKRTILFTCGKINNNAEEYIKKINLSDSEITLDIVTIDKMYDLYIKSKMPNKKLYLSSEYQFEIERIKRNA